MPQHTNRVDEIYHACLDTWDRVKAGLDEEDAAGLLIDVVERLKEKIRRDGEAACQRNHEKYLASEEVANELLKLKQVVPDAWPIYYSAHVTGRPMFTVDVVSNNQYAAAEALATLLRRRGYTVTHVSSRYDDVVKIFCPTK